MTAFTDPFDSGAQTEIDGVLTLKGSSPWNGYRYVDRQGVTWDIDPKSGTSIPIPGLLPALIANKSTPDGWVARTLPRADGKNPYGKVLSMSSAGNAPLVLTLESIDEGAYQLKLQQAKSGIPWWLLLLGAYAWSKSKRGRRR